jgi:hypothetical protein
MSRTARRALVTAAILLITALSFWVFPGHTYLQQDTQIYLPILEHQWNPAVLGGDPIVQRAHVSFTLYDEIADGLRRFTGLPFQTILEGEQLAFRALGFLGIYLLASSFGLGAVEALTVTALVGLGAAIKGSEVLAIEYEPSPRSFAVPLLLLSVGLLAREREWLSGIAAGAAVLLHAPTTWPLLLVVLLYGIRRPSTLRFFVPVGIASFILLWAASLQHGAEPQRFFDRLPPAQEQLQRLRAAYNFVSTWWLEWMPQYVVAAAVATLALRRLKAPAREWWILGGLMLTGLASVPVSAILLEGAKLAIIPQIQPARALLLVVVIAHIAAAAAGIEAAHRRKFPEAAAWLFFALWIPAGTALLRMRDWRSLAVVIVLTALVAFAERRLRLVIAMAAGSAFFLVGGVRNYENIDTPELAELSSWAKTHTVATDVFVFPVSGKDRSAGWFRARALRPVYVDWKGGGQVNYLRDLGYEWWRRWQAVMERPLSLDEYEKLGISYVVTRNPLDSPQSLAFHNRKWFVYSTKRLSGLL